MLLMALTGWLDRRERQAIAYLIEENRLLRRQLGGQRLRLTDDDRRRLAARAYLVGRAALREMATIVSMANLPVVRRRRLIKRATATVIPTQVRIVDERQSGRGHARRSIGCPIAQFGRFARATAAHGSCCNRRVIQPTTVGPPAVPINTRSSAVIAPTRLRCQPAQPRVRAMTVKVLLEIQELALKISGRPEQSPVETFAANRTD